MHEEQLGLIQEYTNVVHIGVALKCLKKGVASCEKSYLNGRDNSDKEESSSEEEQKQDKREDAKFNLQSTLEKTLGNYQSLSQMQDSVLSDRSEGY